MQYNQFYSELGKLLYAIADSDKRISPKEKARLLKIIETDLLPVEQHEDSFGSSVAFYPEIEFAYLENEIVDPEAAFDSFLNFIDKHRTAIDHKMRDTCLHFAKEIAKTDYGITKKEKELLKKLKEKLAELD